ADGGAAGLDGGAAAFAASGPVAGNGRESAHWGGARNAPRGRTAERAHRAGPEDCRGLAGRRGRPGGTGTGRVEDRAGPAARLASSRRAGQRRKQRGRSGELTVSQRQPVWITGVGAATPLGDSYDTIACRLLAGQSGVRTVGTFDVSQHPSQIAGQL